MNRTEIADECSMMNEKKIHAEVNYKNYKKTDI